MIQQIIIDKNRKVMAYKEDKCKVSVRAWQTASRKHTADKLRLIRAFYLHLGYTCVKKTNKLEIYQKEPDSEQ